MAGKAPPSESTRPPTGGGVMFDMDGTLTRPYFDFDAIRREIGLPTEPRTPVLEAMERMTPPARARAQAILDRHEQAGAEASELQDGAREVVAALRGAGLPVGLLTRNCRRSVATVLARHDLTFDAVVAREDGPVKPSPESVLALCRRFGIAPTTVWCVGDYLFDLQAGHAAGATTVLMIGNADPPDYADLANHVIRRLDQLLPLLGVGG